MTEEEKKVRRIQFQAQYFDLLISHATNGTKDRALRELSKRHDLVRERVAQILEEKD